MLFHNYQILFWHYIYMYEEQRLVCNFINTRVQESQISFSYNLDAQLPQINSLTWVEDISASVKYAGPTAVTPQLAAAAIVVYPVILGEQQIQIFGRLRQKETLHAVLELVVAYIFYLSLWTKESRQFIKSIYKRNIDFLSCMLIVDDALAFLATYLHFMYLVKMVLIHNYNI